MIFLYIFFNGNIQRKITILHTIQPKTNYQINILISLFFAFQVHHFSIPDLRTTTIKQIRQLSHRYQEFGLLKHVKTLYTYRMTHLGLSTQAAADCLSSWTSRFSTCNSFVQDSGIPPGKSNSNSFPRRRQNSSTGWLCRKKQKKYSEDEPQIGGGKRVQTQIIERFLDFACIRHHC